MIVALYARVSTTKQAEKDLSIPDQLRQMREWCKSQGFNIATEYVEPGASATNDRRPAFQKMITEACTIPSPYNAIVIHSLSRFFRDQFEFELYKRQLEKYNVQIISTSQPISEDPFGQFTRKMFNLHDELSSALNGLHTLRAMKENARQGFFNGSNPPFGFCTVATDNKGNSGNKKRLRIDQAETNLVKKIFSLYINGIHSKIAGCKTIASHLNKQGITRRGKKWSTSTVADLLSNELYIGNYYFNKKNSKTGKKKPESEWVSIQVDPILNEHTFRQAQTIRQTRNISVTPGSITSSPTLLTGLLKCSYCGARLTLATGKSGKYRYYKCTTRIKKGNTTCISKNLPMGKLDSAVLHCFAESIITPHRVKTLLDELNTRCKQENTTEKQESKKLKKELSKLEERRTRLYEAVEEGILPLDSSLKERAHKLQAKREEILASIAGINRKQSFPLAKINKQKIELFCHAIKEKLFDKSANFGKGYLQLLVDEILVDGNKIKMRGKKAAIAGAITKMDTPKKEVPIIVDAWLPGTGSNRRPSG